MDKNKITGFGAKTKLNLTLNMPSKTAMEVEKKD